MNNYSLELFSTPADQYLYPGMKLTYKQTYVLIPDIYKHRGQKQHTYSRGLRKTTGVNV